MASSSKSAMALTTKTHWLAVLLLFAVSLLLLMTTVSAPIMNHNSFLRVTLANSTERKHSALSFGSFGYCALGVPPVETQQAWCTRSHIGYDITNIIWRASRTNLNTAAGNTANRLVRVMVLHPITCALAFIAFLLTLGGRTVIASLAGLLVTLLTWILVLVAMATDFTAFGIVRNEVNKQARGGIFPTARFGNAMWCLVASFILLTLGLAVLAMSLLGAIKDRRAEKKRVAEAEAQAAAANTQEKKKKRFGIF